MKSHKHKLISQKKEKIPMFKRVIAYFVILVMLLSTLPTFAVLAAEQPEQIVPLSQTMTINGTLQFYSRAHTIATQQRVLVRNLPTIRINVRYNTSGMWIPPQGYFSIYSSIDEHGNFTANVPFVSNASLVELEIHAYARNNVSYITSSLSDNGTPRSSAYAVSVSSYARFCDNY